jgi:hypothetical protein
MVPIRRIYASTLLRMAVLASLLVGVLTVPAPGQAQEISPQFDNWAWFTLLPVTASVCEGGTCWSEDPWVTLTVSPASANVVGDFCGSGSWVGMGTMGASQSTGGGPDWENTYEGPYPQCIPVTYEDGQVQFETTNGASNYSNTVYGFKAGVGYQEGDTVPNPSSVAEWWNWVVSNRVGQDYFIQAVGPVMNTASLTNSKKNTALPTNINGIFFVDLSVEKDGDSLDCRSLAVMMTQSTEKHSLKQDWGKLVENSAISLGKDIGVTIATGNPLGIFIGVASFFGHLIGDLIAGRTTYTESAKFWVQPYTAVDTSLGVPYYVPGKVETPQVTTEPVYSAGTLLIPCGDGTEVWLGFTEGEGSAGGTFDVVYLDKQTISALNKPGPCGDYTDFSYCDSCTGCTQVLHQYLWANHYKVECSSCTENNGGQGDQTTVHCGDPKNIENIDGVLTCKD